MISTVEGELWSNRGNALLVAVLRARYPGLCSPRALERLGSRLYSPGELQGLLGSGEGEEQYMALVEKEGEVLGGMMGAELGEEDQARILGFLASRMMTEVDTTHCTPLSTGKSYLSFLSFLSFLYFVSYLSYLYFLSFLSVLSYLYFLSYLSFLSFLSLLSYL